MHGRLVASLIAAALAAACVKADPPPTAEPPRPVRTVVAQPQADGVVLQLPGEVRPRIESRLGFRVAGKLASRTVSVGDRVAAGQVLARLDPTDLAPAVAAQQAQLTAARTDRDLAAVELDRLRSLRERSYISQAALDRQQAAFDASTARLAAAEAQLQQARNGLDFQVLRADADGVVTAIEAEPGQVVSAGQPVIRVARTAEREVAVSVPEGSLAAARAAGRWTVVVPALGGRALEGRLREVAPISDPASRTYPARIAVAGDTEGLALGMTAVAQVVRPTAPAFVLPMSALHSRDGQPRVWRVDPRTATVEPVAVRTAGYLDDAVRVVDGIAAGDRIVTAGANLLVAGQAVRVLDAGGAAAAKPAAPVAAPVAAPAGAGPAAPLAQRAAPGTAR